jgi:predicted RNase H-like nuclease
MSTSIVGFDSAWTDKVRAPGAICAIHQGGREDGYASFIAPRLASFAQGLEFIAEQRSHAARVVVALDQPTIVPNTTGSRPVDKVAGSLVSWIGGGVQPANRSKAGMFDDAAPLWSFLSALGAREDPEAARVAVEGLHLIEVFPALACPPNICRQAAQRSSSVIQRYAFGRAKSQLRREKVNLAPENVNLWGRWAPDTCRRRSKNVNRSQPSPDKSGAKFTLC